MEIEGMEKKAKVPKLRFPGFTDEWEQRKLGDVFEQTANFVNPNDGEIELWSLTVEDGLTPKSERYNREFLVKKDSNFKEVRSGEIVYNPMNMTLGAVGYNGMSKSVAVSGYYTTMVAKSGYDSYYINTWLKSPQAISLYKTYATGSLIEKQRVQFPTLSIIPTTFPSLEEQSKIGSYFNNLDNLITLHQRKLTHLQAKKKSLLQKMFPKKGERFPELRFPGFADAWEQRNAGKIFMSITDKNHPELPVLSASQELGMIKRDDSGINIQHEVKSESTYKHVMPGQFVIHLRSFQGGFAHSNVEGITSPAYTVMDFNKKEQHNDLFWKYIFMRQEFIDSLVKVTYGIRDGRSISYKDFCTLLVYYPNCAEQQQIGSFFQRFDKLITLHQRKLTHLQTQKKALLQQMFV